MRKAIEESNLNGVPDTIVFNISGCPPACTISPTSALPTISDDDTSIDGTTQPGDPGVPLIEIDGSSAGSSVTGLTVTGDRATIEGLIINSFDAAGIGLLGSDGSVIIGNYVGLGPSGAVGAANGTGIVISQSAANSTIGGHLEAHRNIISGNTGAGIDLSGLSGTAGNRIVGNFIGTDVTGTQALGNGIGVQLSDGVQNNTVGSSTAVERNVISGNGTGVRIAGADTQQNAIYGNYIGTDLTGGLAIPNTTGVHILNGARFNSVGGTATSQGNVISANSVYGVDLNDADDNAVYQNLIGVTASGDVALGNATGVSIRDGASTNFVGNSNPKATNIISGNAVGVSISGVGSENNSVQNNLIGLDVTGAFAIGNGRGIVVNASADGNKIGGPGDEGNVISGSDGGVDPHGITITFADGITIQGNLIGTDVSGANPVPNAGSGIHIGPDSSDNAVGATTAGFANVIAFNGGAGVSVLEQTPAQPARGNVISGNSIHSNSGLGIDLALDGSPTPNDDGDFDGGANHHQNYPELSLAVTGSLHVEGSLNSATATNFRIELFASDECDPSGHGEGQEFLAFPVVTTDEEGNLDFSLDILADVAPGRFITATATNLAIDATSEFSECLQVTVPATPTPTPSPTPVPSPTPPATPTPIPGPTFLQGDNNCDGNIQASDALVALRHIAGFSTNQQPGCPTLGDALPAAQPAGEPPDLFGDVDCDDDVDSVDALKILRSVAAFSVTQNEPCTDVGDPL